MHGDVIDYTYYCQLKLASPGGQIMSNYLVADFSADKWDFNIGIGHVSGQSTDKTVFKAIIGFPF